MKYGESTFDIIYLLFAIISGIVILAFFAPLLPMLGMLMLPKTVCYMLILGIFLKAVKSR